MENLKKHCGPESTIQNTAFFVEKMPAPKKAAVKKKAEAPKPPPPDAGDAGGDGPAAEKPKPPPKAKKPPAPMMPVYEPLPEPAKLTVEQALKGAVGWSNSNNIAKKFSVGTLTTAGYNEKCSVFKEMNSLAEEKSSVLPMSNFQLKHRIDPDKDRFDRRIVK